ncbi:hypothetical protein [uncultured Thiocystis sp.]|jgi:hypothetical protein|uniref:hypothetical protein n=1 Tax=uncultured Thiocystis sp. TaxID=1202134 RepID=UPI0025F6F258|nr:hypothetical protein [uncultured Thiocystis sp.]
MTPAERMARTRQKARAALASEDPAPIDQIPDTALLEALRVSYRQAQTHDMAACVAELFRRANPRAVAGQSLLVTFTLTPDALEATAARFETQAHGKNMDPPSGGSINALSSVTETDTATVTEIYTATVAETDIATVTEISSRGYPPHIRSMAIAMTDERKTNAEIRAEIRSRLGRSPDKGNLPRLVRSWRRAAES